jgi:hypothetical protein
MKKDPHMNTTSSIPTQTLGYRAGSTDMNDSTLSDDKRSHRPEVNKKTLKSFEATMAEITRHMPLHERLFSRLIHARAVTILSDIIGSTLARPDALLAGGVFSFALTLAAYVLAKNLGYTLSGFESIGTFVFGWVLGLAYDFLKLMITGKR